MVLNAFVPHLAATLFLRRYAPGLLTGLLLLVPVNSILLAQAIASGDLNWRQLAGSTIVVAGALLGLLPVLFGLGRWATRGKRRG